MVITEKDYDPQGETTVGQPRAWKIREWLHNNYESEKLLYVMFIGNPKPNYGDVPMFLCREILHPTMRMQIARARPGI
jgi:hypothetical protein